MLHFSLFDARTPFTSIEASLARLLANRGRAEELRELSGVLHDRIHRVAPALEIAGPRPLHVHARYSRNEALAAFGMENLNGTFGSGVRWVPGDQADVFFVTLVKSEAHFSPTTMYADHAISPTVFQWESQSTTAEKSPTGQRYINHRELGSSCTSSSARRRRRTERSARRRTCTPARCPTLAHRRAADAHPCGSSITRCRPTSSTRRRSLDLN